MLLGPFVTAVFGVPRQTAAVCVVAVLAVALGGWWNANAGSADHVVRLLVVTAGVAFALAGAQARARLRRDQERFRLLSAVAETADADLPADETVRRLTDLLVPALADVCAIDMLGERGLKRIDVAAWGPEARAVEDGLRARDPAARVSALAGEDEPRLLAEVGEDLLRALSRDDDELAFLRRVDPRSALVLPLRARGRAMGTLLLLVTGASGRRYDDEDLAFAVVLRGRVALALRNAGLSAELESLEAQHAAALSNLVEAVTIQDASGRLVYANDAAARTLGFGSADELLATPPTEILDAYRSFHEDGSPLSLEELPGRQVLAGREPRPLVIRAIHKQTGEERWQVVKASAVPGADGRPRMAVNVIEDVTEVKRAELAQRFLAEAGAVLSSSLDYERTLRRTAELAVPRLADWCTVSLPGDDGFMRAVAVAHVDPERVRFARDYQRRYPVPVDAPGGSAQVLRDGVSQVLNDISDELIDATLTDPEQREAIREIGMRAAVIVPIVAATGVIGAISLVSAESGRTFTPADVALAEELGRRAGTAVENARLYTERSHVARTLQAGLLPDDLPEIPGLALASLYRPAGSENVVGGDFYDAFASATGWMLVVGDVTGRGAEAAALTGQARHTLRTAATLLDDPAAAVDQLNRALVTRADLPICTVAAVKLAECGGATRATVVCAGHPLPMLVHDGRARPVGRSGPVVGAWPDESWPVETVELRPGDLLVLYTDGVLDARGSAGRFGESRLQEALAPATGAADAVARVRAALDAFERDAQADDTAVLVVERVGVAHARAVAGATGAEARGR